MKTVMKSMFAAVFAAVASGVFAGTYTFNNPAGGNFSEPSNWAGGEVPPHDFVRHAIVINVDGTGVAVTNDLPDFTVSSISINNAAGSGETYRIALRGNPIYRVGSITANCYANVYTRLESDISTVTLTGGLYNHLRIRGGSSAPRTRRPFTTAPVAIRRERAYISMTNCTHRKRISTAVATRR